MSERDRLVRAWFATVRRYLGCKDEHRSLQLYRLAFRLTDRLNRIEAGSQRRLWWVES